MGCHPCFDKEAHFQYGRIHLPVAPRCNIQCRYCDRKYDCPNESRPGVTSMLLTPQNAALRAEKLLAENSRMKVVGIAGPGEPLANEETFETFSRIDHEKYGAIKCVSTNGLLLEQSIEKLSRCGVTSVTVTMNTLDAIIGAKIYRWVQSEGRILEGKCGAEQLICQQLDGIWAAAERGFRVKVNTVVIPEINDGDLTPLARTLSQLGVSIMNINSIIPAGEWSGMQPVSAKRLHEIRTDCGEYLPQFTDCRQCRADAVGIPGLEKPCCNLG